MGAILEVRLVTKRRNRTIKPLHRSRCSAHTDHAVSFVWG